jgi:organic radical activating enzyme
LAPAIDWLTVSPKKGAAFKAREGNELKIVLGAIGKDGWTPDDLTEFEHTTNFQHHVVQPMDEGDAAQAGPIWRTALARCVQYVGAHPRWRVGIQLHKLASVP